MDLINLWHALGYIVIAALSGLGGYHAGQWRQRSRSSWLGAFDAMPSIMREFSTLCNTLGGLALTFKQGSR